MKETQLTVCLRLGLLLRACEAGGRGLCLYQLNECFIKHQLHMMISDPVIISHSLAALYAKYSPTHGWAPRLSCQGSCATLSCLYPQVAHTNATVCLSLLKSCRNNKPHLITRALHGCMITVLCMVEVCWRQMRYMVGSEVCWLLWTLQRGICSLWFPHGVICCVSR